MSRIRTVKPELFKHEDLFDAEQNSQLPLRLAFIGLFTVADREGRFRWRPRTLKLDVLPHDFIDFAAILNALEQAGFIERYEVDSEIYGWIPTFTKHQRFTGKEAETKSLLPPPPPQQHRGNIRETSGKHPDASPSIHRETLGKHPGTQEREWNKGREGERKGEEATPAPLASPLASPVIVSPATEDPQTLANAIQAPKPAKATKAPIPADWTPAEATYALLEKSGIDRPFAESCLDEFRLYWTEQQEQRPGWEATFVNNVKRQWERRPTLTPRNGPRHPPPAHAMTPEVAEFDAILQNLNATKLRPVIEGECSHASH